MMSLVLIIGTEWDMAGIRMERSGRISKNSSSTAAVCSGTLG
jgi:hypothetical protein